MNITAKKPLLAAFCFSWSRTRANDNKRANPPRYNTISWYILQILQCITREIAGCVCLLCYKFISLRIIISTETASTLWSRSDQILYGNVINPVTRYDIHGKKLFELIYKYYFADHGIRNYLCGFNIRSGIEKIMENVVYLHLLRQGFKVDVGILRAGEIDFVATRGDKRIYVQVTYLLASDETIAREFGNLAAIKDNYPKYVVSMDPVSGGLDDYPGIQHLHLREFLKTDF